MSTDVCLMQQPSPSLSVECSRTNQCSDDTVKCDMKLSGLFYITWIHTFNLKAFINPSYAPSSEPDSRQTMSRGKMFWSEATHLALSCRWTAGGSCRARRSTGRSRARSSPHSLLQSWSSYLAGSASSSHIAEGEDKVKTYFIKNSRSLFWPNSVQHVAFKHIIISLILDIQYIITCTWR